MTTNNTVKKKKDPNARPTIGTAFELGLCAEVNQICPNCGRPLFTSNKGRRYRNYEIAHIYPLNPTSGEVDLLKNERKLSADPNHEDNLIPLCYDCHNIFDNPKTVENYRELVDTKLALIKRRQQSVVFSQFQIEQDIVNIIDSLSSDNVQFDVAPTLEAKRVDDKLADGVSPFVRQKIKNDVISFYIFIRDRFADLERSDPGKAMLIAMQVKTFYQKQKLTLSNKQEIFDSVVEWVTVKHPATSSQVAEAIAAFYVQNCELFE
ncbi:TPA: HNH endonuclease [Burkholderia cenocepacia]|uniref:ABC-three component system protein n=1 Tax=Burkholderia cenocepacia TaxID=95486 RepID=UPI00158B48CE|nr:ABC-three component system protein [Burkholderia cenocepacia]HEM7896581.1 HNH endonuclease [Burkholderia cenocepacia]